MGRFSNAWSPEDDERLRALRAEGRSFLQCARELGRSRNSVASRCGKLGITAPKFDARQRLAQFADELAERGDVTLAALACGISSQHGRNLFGQLRRELGWQAQ